MREEPLMQTPRMVEVSRQNAEAANRGVTNIARTVAGGEVDTAPGAVARATDVVRAQERELRGKVNAAYDRFRETKAYVPDHEAWNVPRRVKKALTDFDVTPGTTPNAARALEIVQETFGDTQTALSARNIDVARRKLRNLGVANAADGKARNIIIREMDQWLDDAVQNGLVNGDPQAIQFLKDARKLNTDLSRRFGDMGIGKDVDRIVGRMLQQDATVDELARMIYGAGQVSAPTATRALQRVKAAMGQGAKPEWDQLRAQVLRSAMTGRGDQPLGVRAIHNNLSELLTNRPEMMKTLFRAEELAAVKRLTFSMKPLLREVDNRSSGTTERLMRMVGSTLSKYPLIRTILGPVQEAAETTAANRALTPLLPKRSPAVPAAAAAGLLALPDYLNQRGSSNGR